MNITTGRKPVKDRRELLSMANRGEPLRVTEIALLTGSHRQTVERVINRATEKLMDLIKVSPTELQAEHTRRTKRRGVRI